MAIMGKQRSGNWKKDFIDSCKEIKHDRKKRNELIYNITSIIIMCTFIFLWVEYPFVYMIKSIDTYGKQKHFDVVLAMSALLGSMLPLVIIASRTDSWIVRPIFIMFGWLKDKPAMPKGWKNSK